MIEVSFAGNFLGNGGMGTYARALHTALARRARVRPVHEGPGTEGSAAAPPSPSGPRLWIRHGWSHAGPASFRGAEFAVHIGPDPRRSVLVLPFDPTLLHRDRIDAINRTFGSVWTDSAHTRDRAVAGGITVPATVLPAPVWAPGHACPPRRTAGPFTFLHVANGSLTMKGTDLVLDAFVAAFGPHESVALHLKTSGTGGDHAAGAIRDLVAARVPPRMRGTIRLSVGAVPHTRMVDLYHAADCYVFASRSESLGLPPLEAAACGLPVIAHRGGAMAEYADVMAQYPVGYDVAPMPAGVYRDNAPTTWCVVRTDSLATQMRRAVERRAVIVRPASAIAALAGAFDAAVARAVDAAVARAVDEASGVSR